MARIIASIGVIDEKRVQICQCNCVLCVCARCMHLTRGIDLPTSKTLSLSLSFSLSLPLPSLYAYLFYPLFLSISFTLSLSHASLTLRHPINQTGHQSWCFSCSSCSQVWHIYRVDISKSTCMQLTDTPLKWPRRSIDGPRLNDCPQLFGYS